MVLHRGKIATKPEILEVRPLVREDLALLLQKRVDSNGRPLTGSVSRFRDTHHRMARLFASGMSVAQVVEVGGYSYTRVSILHNDPAFMDLIAEYRGSPEVIDEARDHLAEIATRNMLKAETMLSDRLDQADEEGVLLPVRDLVSISGDRMDRFGYGKNVTQTNLNVDFASTLERAIARSGKTIEGSIIHPQSSLAGPAQDTAPERPLIQIEAAAPDSNSLPPQSPVRADRMPIPQSPQGLKQPALRRRA